MPTSEIHDEKHKDANGKMMFKNMIAGVVEESQLAGRESEKELITNLILKHSDKHLEVIAVWGMGGIGKTTLVTDVYQRQEINEKFAKHAFVTVLRPFKLQELLRSIAIQLDADSSGRKAAMDFARGKDDYTSMSVDRLTKALDGLSQDRNCLIVVDDLLCTTEWDAIIKAFREIGKASWTIVITTRQKDIAEHCCKKPECIHMLNILEAKEAHDLFIKTVLKRFIQFISFVIMICITISTTLLKLALKRDSLEYFVEKKYDKGKDLYLVYMLIGGVLIHFNIKGHYIPKG
jgi:hypothetical protein